MRHQFYPQRPWREELVLGTRLKAAEDAHRAELAALERTLMRRVLAAERLCGLVLFEHECLKRQLGALAREVAEMKEGSKQSSVVGGWEEVDDSV